MTRGRFITFEGGEGAGKSTQVQRLMARLDAAGIRAMATREPGGSPRAEEFRKVLLSGAAKELGPMAEALLFSAARSDHLEHTIRPALARGIWVVCDRFADSTRAYQGALGNLEPAVIRAMERIVVGSTYPDLTLILDLPPELGLARAEARRNARNEGTDRFEAEDVGFHRVLRKAFLDIAEAEPERCVVIDASAAPEIVEERVWEAVKTRLAPATTRIKGKDGVRGGH
ncbi:dTMP kinase [Chelatococcus sp. SYSU_G07232]|uniref:Thymidylate kinase n=1 Tax=Chelatococcus albus TaxID=3047466 RepID=A0ABT7ABQ1_9HYPH|nr:dTMP kinase [Chelatococcus sp. SYSU_G07232]MDJ1156792.1 dTMP kinase [Chelatococcus sp. SYSU_G07232]